MPGFVGLVGRRRVRGRSDDERRADQAGSFGEEAIHRQGYNTTVEQEPAAKPHAPDWRDVPRRLRGIIRGNGVWMVVLGALAGIAAGLAVALIGTASSTLHALLFGLRGERLS